jgi:hypothetical protein
MSLFFFSALTLCLSARVAARRRRGESIIIPDKHIIYTYIHTYIHTCVLCVFSPHYLCCVVHNEDFI